MTVEQWLGPDNKIGIDIWKRKYQHNNESFEEWLDRVSSGVDIYKEAIRSKKFIPGGRILSGRGVDDCKMSLSNCYVIEPPKDNLESIYDSRKKLARTYSYGGGCGIDISKLAPRGAKVGNAARESSGAVSFMAGYSQVTEEIGQQGRRGALMISLDCHHPDFPEFIDIKAKPDSVTKANISTRITNDFMQCAVEHKEWIMEFSRPETNETITKTAMADKLFDRLCENNWNWAEPGILFWDRIESWNLLSNNPKFKYAGTNPCAEEPLPAGGSCLLGSINLSAFVKDKEFDIDSFVETVDIGIRFLNDVLDEGLPKHPLKEQRETVRDWRQCGLGIMGLADMLIEMEIPYSSPRAREISNEIGLHLINSALATSAMLAKKDGTYPKYTKAVRETPFYKKNVIPEVDDLVDHYGLRNSQLLTIAPTGTISTMLGVSGGMEPIFANSYTRKTESLHGHDEYYKIYTPIVDRYMKANGITEEEELPDWFETSATIAPKDRVCMQGVWQSHIDASISSTVNLPKEATIDDVKEIYLTAWKQGLKGITVYRSGCMREGVLTTNKSKEEEKKFSTILGRGDILVADDNVIGLKRKLTSGCGSLHVQAFFDPNTGLLQETYFSKGSTGGCNNFMIGLSRMISLASRAGVGLEDIVDQLNSCGACPSYATRHATKHDTSPGACCPMAIGRALLEMSDEFRDWMENNESNEIRIPRVEHEKQKAKINKCPQCGEELIQEGGCIICKNCGWSKCD